MIGDLRRDTKILDDRGHLTLLAASYFEDVTRVVNLNTPIQGTGSPEGVITAEVSQMYMDLSGAAESVLYVKQSGSGNTGWKLV